MSIWTNHVSGAERHVWPAALSAALSFVTRFEEEPPLSWLSQLGCKLPLCKNRTKHQVTLKPRPANLAKALAQGGIHSPGGLCPGFSQIPSSAVTSCCVCLPRAMVCSQRNASLSQSPRVGFLSSLLPQSKKSPSRLSPAQGPPQAQSLAKKEPFGGQVSTRPAFLTLARRPLTSGCAPLGPVSLVDILNSRCIPFLPPCLPPATQTSDGSAG